jgi:hypothetical protein
MGGGSQVPGSHCGSHPGEATSFMLLSLPHHLSPTAHRHPPSTTHPPCIVALLCDPIGPPLVPLLPTHPPPPLLAHLGPGCSPGVSWRGPRRSVRVWRWDVGERVRVGPCRVWGACRHRCPRCALRVSVGPRPRPRPRGPHGLWRRPHLHCVRGRQHRVRGRRHRVRWLCRGPLRPTIWGRRGLHAPVWGVHLWVPAPRGLVWVATPHHGGWWGACSRRGGVRLGGRVCLPEPMG